MSAEFFGGPLDGAVSSTVPAHMPVYLVATNHPESPVYKRRCCVDCASHRDDKVPYCFVGYEHKDKLDMSIETVNWKESA